jgi:GT2 family glycosyltransferase
MSPLVGIVILNRNQSEYTINCIGSVFNSDYKNYIVYVVDNGSDDGSPEEIKQVHPEINLIRNKTNTGFSAGNNKGIRKALEDGAEYILLLNNDTEIRADMISELTGTLLADGNIGITGAANLYLDDREKIWMTGGYVNRWLAKPYCPDNLKEYAEVKVNTAGCDYVPGSCLMMRKELIEKAGLLPEEYFVYYEDVDYCLKAGQAGYRVVCNTGAVLWHKVSASFGKVENPFPLFLRIRNKAILFKKYGFTPAYPVFIIYYFIYVIFFAIKQLIFGRGRGLMSVVKGAWSGIKVLLGFKPEPIKV